MITVGIDNGLSGGIVALSPLGQIIDMIPMPTLTHKHDFRKEKTLKRHGVPTKTKEIHQEAMIDTRSLFNCIMRVTDWKPCVVAVEECPEHAAQKSVMRSMGISYGAITGIVNLTEQWTLKIVRSGNPMDSWQRALLGNVPQGQTKEYALAKARELWPRETFLALRGRTPHSGMIDAALIAHFTRTNKL